jgi:phosphorylase kinase alpha/beta subunit
MENIEYWKLPDSGIWEEAKENRTSSCGAVVSGLVYMKNMGFKVDIPKLVDGMHHYLYKLLPQETKTRETDLSLLTLIFPFLFFLKEWHYLL